MKASPDTPLARAMAAAGVDDPTLAELAGTSKQQVFKLRHGHLGMKTMWAERLAPHLGVTPAALLGLEAAPDVPADQLQPSSAPAAMIREYDVGASAGHGVAEQPLDGHGNHPVLAEWTIPRDYLASFTGASSSLAIIRVEGDSMEPEYGPGERVLVDLARKKPSPSGIFVVWDGMGLVLKRVEYVPYSDPPRIRLMSANPAYGTYEVELQEHTIVARVIGRWQWR